MVTPVILAGGSGTRLWPLSRDSFPKQFLPLWQGKSLFQATVQRVVPLMKDGRGAVLTSRQHFFTALEQLQDLGLADRFDLILEPCGRNTAPAAVVAALFGKEQGGDTVLLLPSDHLVADQGAFAEAVKTASALCQEGPGGQPALVTFGITPDSPHTGYGYIEADGNRAVSFKEKPDLATAERYLDQGNYLWNSGMFAFLPDTLLEETGSYAKAIREQAEAAYKRRKKVGDGQLLDEEAFAACPSDSIDYAVMEHSKRVAVVPANIGWNDIGSWESLHQCMPNKDKQGLTTEGDVMALDTENSLIHAGSRLVATLGLKDTIVVETEDAVLVADQAHSQRVKDIVAGLNEAGRIEGKRHLSELRPWGFYSVLLDQPGYKAKLLSVKPGARMSLQMHNKRAEHWVVVKGTARIIRGEETIDLNVGDHTFIPIGTKHRIANPGPERLEMVEVQCGEYLGEDDIVRYEDDYHRP